MERLFSRVVTFTSNSEGENEEVPVEVAPFSTMMVLPSYPIVLSRTTNQPTVLASTITLMPLLQQTLLSLGVLFQITPRLMQPEGGGAAIMNWNAQPTIYNCYFFVTQPL